MVCVVLVALWHDLTCSSFAGKDLSCCDGGSWQRQTGSCSYSYHVCGTEAPDLVFPPKLKGC